MHQNRSKGILSKWLSQWEDLFRQHRRFVIHGQENKVCRLIKSLNGLKQAPKQYHERFDTVMTAFEFKHYSVDRCIYSKCTYEYTISEKSTNFNKAKLLCNFFYLLRFRHIQLSDIYISIE